MKNSVLLGLGAVSALLVAGSAQGADIDLGTFALSNGSQSASATFTFDNVANQLTIQLTNTMTDNSGPQWLTGMFFDLSGADITGYDASGDVSMTSMVTMSGTTQTPYGSGTDADHFWAFRDDLDTTPPLLPDPPFSGQQYGIGAAGFDIFGSSDILDFDGSLPTPQPDGTDGGILADIPGLQVPGGHEGKPFVLGSLWLTFDLGNFTGDDLEISSVNFAFGTGFDETVLIPVPLAAPLALAGLGLVAVGRKRLARSLAS